MQKDNALKFVLKFIKSSNKCILKFSHHRTV